MANEVFDPSVHVGFGYIPSKTVAIIMIALFSVSSLLHTGQAFYHKTYWLLPTAVLCGALEVLGWAGRLWENSEPWNQIPFQIQICCTIVAPTPLLAASFVIFGEIIKRLGTTYSRLTPKLYTIIFVTCDVVSLVVQGAGGGLAATAGPENGRDPDVGGNIMLGGIAFQLVVIVVFFFCALEFIIRYLKDRPIRAYDSENASDQQTPRGYFTGRLKIMLSALTFSTLVLFIRAVYRTIELADGWSGRIIRTELYFNVLDGAMIVLAIYTINIVHPGVFLFIPSSLSNGNKA